MESRIYARLEAMLSYGHPHMLQEVGSPSHFGAVLGTETLDVLERQAIPSFVELETDLQSKVPNDFDTSQHNNLMICCK